MTNKLFKKLIRFVLIILFVGLIFGIIFTNFDYLNKEQKYKRHINKSIESIDKEDYIDAENQLLKALKYTNENNSEVYEKLGSLYLKLSDTKNAIKYFTKAVEVDPRNDFAYAELGWSYYEQGNFTIAKKMFNESVAINSKNDLGYIGLAKIATDSQEFNLAKIFFDKAKSISSENELWYLEYGTFLRISSQFSKALKILEEGSNKFPENQYILYEIGIVYTNLGNYSKAQYYFEDAIDAGFVNSYCPYEGLGIVYLKQGDSITSKKMFEKALKLNPNLNISDKKMEEVYGEKNLSDDFLSETLLVNKSG